MTSVVVLDVNETLSDLSPIGDAFEAAGLPRPLSQAWFAGVLRDGFAVTVAGESRTFRELATDGLRTFAARHEVEADLLVDAVLGRFAELEVHPDVVPGVEAMAEAGLRLVTLSNGAAAIAEGLLERAGIRDRIEHVLSVDDAGIWKPAPAAYAHALEVCGVDAPEAALVAVHPWDVDGAQRAGLTGAWLDRDRTPYPLSFRPPDVTAPSLVGLAAQLRR